MKLSVIINVYNSHGAVARQVKHFQKMDLPKDLEIIFVDDGSTPPLITPFTTLYTNDKRPWTQGLARNAGAYHASGEYLLMTDVDHILSEEAIWDSYQFTGDKMIFPRFLGVLLEDGSLTQDEDILLAYGAFQSLQRGKRGLYASYHGNTFCMKKETFLKLGGYDPKHCELRHHAKSKQGEDSVLNRAWNHYAAPLGLKPEVGSPIYIFPIGRYNRNYDLNPMGLFHTLSYEAVPQPDKA